jgi:hypothetical protein
MYKGKDMAKDIIEIMVSEGVGMVVGVAHDWYVLRFILSFCQSPHLYRFYLEEGFETVPSEHAIMLTRLPPGGLSFCHA